jgi:hypothetical protein
MVGKPPRAVSVYHMWEEEWSHCTIEVAWQLTFSLLAATIMLRM